MRFESRGVQKKKKNKTKRFITLKIYLFSYSFSLLVFFYTSKLIIGFFNNYDYLMKI
jgi:hypothetical protein